MRDNVTTCLARLGGYGNIVMGDSINPTNKLPGQTQQEFDTLNSWFSEQVSLF